ncbi:hypothetical protein GUJ93_ZPchr0012g21617 [Zizania palustris]|uniref:Uncharacterized protein n=1 Tax=Zizania palustris TaxID=103762 RepID=A0A8J5WPS3_ZIZPA|nr:hypothetical protein GUJ93_ZPchr0012g21617 [Zizania palustris]
MPPPFLAPLPLVLNHFTSHSSTLAIASTFTVDVLLAVVANSRCNRKPAASFSAPAAFIPFLFGVTSFSTPSSQGSSSAAPERVAAQGGSIPSCACERGCQKSKEATLSKKVESNSSEEDSSNSKERAHQRYRMINECQEEYGQRWSKKHARYNMVGYEGADDKKMKFYPELVMIDCLDEKSSDNKYVSFS